MAGLAESSTSQRADNHNPENNVGLDHTAPVRHRKTNTKRARGLISCAECARLKVRCDKNIPCSSCVRRGCSTICPNGVLSGKQGTRYVLANTEVLHNKIREMCERIRQLEDALAILQATTSPSPHPLLREELLAIKKGTEVTVEGLDDDITDVSVTDEFGTLSISDHGISRFIGRTGGLESLLVASTLEYGNSLEVDDPEDNINNINDVPIEILMNNIAPYLPAFERASTLCETYMEQSSWFMRPLTREQLINELLMPVYKRTPSNGYSSTSNGNSPICLNNAHELALLLMVFALGSLADLTSPAPNQEAKTFHKLALGLINIESILINPSVATVQTLCLLSNYYVKSDGRSSREKSWSLIRLASVVASNIGLHRDPSKWKLDAKSTQKRREVFWQIYTLECSQSLANGRPPICALRYSDCEYPIDTEETLKDDGTVEPSFWRWRNRFAKEIIHHLADIGCRIGPVKYSEVLELDRRIRDFEIPEKFKAPLEESSWETDGAQLCMQRALVITIRDVSFMYLHRGFFAKALLQYAKDPISSPFAPSFLATYRSSLSSLQCVRAQFKLCPEMMLRTWALWKHAFSALIVIGSVITRAPHCNLAPSALKELSQGMELFKTAVGYTKTAKHAYSVLLALQEHAVKAYSQYRNGQRRLIDGEAVNPEDTINAWENELAIFSGHTTLIEPRTSRSSGSSPRWSVPTPSTNGSPPQQSLKTVTTDIPLATHGVSNGFTQEGYSHEMQNVDMQNWNAGNFLSSFNDSFTQPLDAEFSTYAPTSVQPMQNVLLTDTTSDITDWSQTWQNSTMDYSEFAELLGFEFGHGKEMAEDWSSLLQRVTNPTASNSFSQP